MCCIVKHSRKEGGREGELIKHSTPPTPTFDECFRQIHQIFAMEKKELYYAETPGKSHTFEAFFFSPRDECETTRS